MGLKFYIGLQVQYRRRVVTEREIGEQFTDAHHFTSCRRVLLADDIVEMVDQALQQLEDLSFSYQNMGSDWLFFRVLDLTIHVVNYRPTKGSSYIPLPEWIKNKKVSASCVIHIINV
jgi:hypothetical protein